MKKQTRMQSVFQSFLSSLRQGEAERQERRGTERRERERDRETAPRSSITSNREGREGNAFGARGLQYGCVWKRVGETEKD